VGGDYTKIKNAKERMRLHHAEACKTPLVIWLPF